MYNLEKKLAAMPVPAYASLPAHRAGRGEGEVEQRVLGGDEAFKTPLKGRHTLSRDVGFVRCDSFYIFPQGKKQTYRRHPHHD